MKRRDYITVADFPRSEDGGGGLGRLALDKRGGFFKA